MFDVTVSSTPGRDNVKETHLVVCPPVSAHDNTCSWSCNDMPEILKNRTIDYISHNSKDLMKRLAIENALKPHSDRFRVYSSTSSISNIEITPQLFSPQHTIKPGALLISYSESKLISLLYRCDCILAQKTPTNQYINFLVSTYNYLIKSIQIMHQSNIIHGKLDKSTVCIYESSDSPIIHNFSHAFYLTDPQLNPDLLTYTPSDIFIPFELHLLAFGITNKLTSLSSANIEKVYNDVRSASHPILFTELEIHNKFHPFVNNHIGNLYKYVMKTISKLDIYALNVLFVILFEKANSPFAKKYSKLLTQTHSNLNYDLLILDVSQFA